MCKEEDGDQHMAGRRLDFMYKIAASKRAALGEGEDLAKKVVATTSDELAMPSNRQGLRPKATAWK